MACSRRCVSSASFENSGLKREYGRGAHVEHELDVVVLEDAHEIVQRAAAVADGEDRDRFRTVRVRLVQESQAMPPGGG